jgi:SAM-dependent methyltransferase
MRYASKLMSAEISAGSRVTALRNWYQRPLGRLLAETELNALAAQLPNLFGYYLMLVDPPWQDCPLEDSRIPHHFIQSVAPVARDASGLAGHIDNWPIQTDSIDAIILPHTLELSRDPHQVLREADRSLIPDGHLVILGFNPYGPWGMRRVFTPGHRQMPWDSRFLGVNRIKDWLALLGFDTLESHYLFHRPPVQNMRLLEKLQFLENASGYGSKLLSAAYILVAQKRTTIMTPLKSTHARRRRLFPVGIPSSSQDNVRRARHH